VVRERPQLAAAAVKALFDAEARIASTRAGARSLPRVRTTEEITGDQGFEFKIGFDQRFIDDLVAQAEWAIAAGLSPKPEGDLRALLRGLV
jgi:hypothetical protein